MSAVICPACGERSAEDALRCAQCGEVLEVPCCGCGCAGCREK